MAREQCGVFAVCFRLVFRLFSSRLRVSRNGTVFQWDSKRTDRNEKRPPACFGTPEGSYPFRSRDRLRMGPIRATFFNPRCRPSRTVPVKLTPSPDARHFSMGPAPGRAFLPATRPDPQTEATLAPSGDELESAFERRSDLRLAGAVCSLSARSGPQVSKSAS